MYWTILQSFKLIRYKNKNFVLKSFLIAVTLKYGQGHWKSMTWYDLNE